MNRNMPHLFLEYTDNLLEEPDFANLFSKCHLLLTEIAKADPRACKSRATKITAFFTGSGEPKDAFIHLHVLLASGRSSETKKELGTALLSLFKNEFAERLKNHDLQITIHVDEFDKDFYFKFPSSV